MVSKIGRNEPCPCGSGKKYKKCCMQAQESTEKAEHSMRENIFSFSVEPRFKDDLKEAKDIFFEGREPDDGGKRMFTDWFIHDYRLKDYGKSIIELFYLEKLPHLSPLEKETLEGWQNTVIGVYEVTGIERGKGVYIKDIFDNNENFVNDISSSRGMEKWDVVTLRVITVGGKYYLSGGTYILPPSAKADIIRYGEEEFLRFKKEKPEASWREFMKYFGHKFIKFAYKKATQLPKIITPEGDPIVFAKAVYKVKDYEKAVTQKTIVNDPVLEELKVKFLEDHYRKWVDMPIPFLDNRTPREASKHRKEERS